MRRRDASRGCGCLRQDAGQAACMHALAVRVSEPEPAAARSPHAVSGCRHGPPGTQVRRVSASRPAGRPAPQGGGIRIREHFPPPIQSPRSQAGRRRLCAGACEEPSRASPLRSHTLGPAASTPAMAPVPPSPPGQGGRRPCGPPPPAPSLPHRPAARPAAHPSPSTLCLNFQRTRHPVPHNSHATHLPPPACTGSWRRCAPRPPPQKKLPNPSRPACLPAPNQSCLHPPIHPPTHTKQHSTHAATHFHMWPRAVPRPHPTPTPSDSPPAPPCCPVQATTPALVLVVLTRWAPRWPA